MVVAVTLHPVLQPWTILRITGLFPSILDPHAIGFVRPIFGSRIPTRRDAGTGAAREIGFVRPENGVAIVLSRPGNDILGRRRDWLRLLSRWGRDCGSKSWILQLLHDRRVLASIAPNAATSSGEAP
jgi:hypothetical protein